MSSTLDTEGTPFPSEEPQEQPREGDCRAVLCRERLAERVGRAVVGIREVTDLQSPAVLLFAYLETGLFATVAYGGEWENDPCPPPLQEVADTVDFTDSAVRKADSDCAAFLSAVEEALGDTDEFPAWEALGQDFFFTRNGHGAGFWDGRYPEEQGKILTRIAKSFGESEPYLIPCEPEEEGGEVEYLVGW